MEQCKPIISLFSGQVCLCVFLREKNEFVTVMKLVKWLVFSSVNELENLAPLCVAHPVSGFNYSIAAGLLFCTSLNSE